MYEHMHFIEDLRMQELNKKLSLVAEKAMEDAKYTQKNLYDLIEQLKSDIQKIVEENKMDNFLEKYKK